MTLTEIYNKLSNDSSFTDVELCDDQVTFRVVDPDHYFESYYGHEVMWNDCDGYEDEGAVLA